MHRPSSAKLWQMPTPPTVLPTMPALPRRTVPLDEHDTSYLADSASTFSLWSTCSFIRLPFVLFPAKVREKNVCSPTKPFSETEKCQCSPTKAFSETEKRPCSPTKAFFETETCLCSPTKAFSEAETRCVALQREVPPPGKPVEPEAAESSSPKIFRKKWPKFLQFQIKLYLCTP